MIGRFLDQAALPLDDGNMKDSSSCGRAQTCRIAINMLESWRNYRLRGDVTSARLYPWSVSPIFRQTGAGIWSRSMS